MAHALGIYEGSNIDLARSHTRPAKSCAMVAGISAVFVLSVAAIAIVGMFEPGPVAAWAGMVAQLLSGLAGTMPAYKSTRVEQPRF